MRARIRLGPFVIFLVIIAMILTMLALLSFATSNADEALAERYAQVTQTKYELEKRGKAFLCEIEEEIQSGKELHREDLILNEEGNFEHTEELGTYRLWIGFSIKDGACLVTRWKIGREWETSESKLPVWQPEEAGNETE